ncbi:hypothetical protein EMPS_08837 [Entomortierella parvispora]|uniref:Uncharacterized protein n=1 Tax=Entomortierella parvispora TaxID=205924 RepID=A0A9P3LZR3_9FUNG|nr:hypothetical protein EMPS_08837 [Entomortierella parvispora]
MSRLFPQSSERTSATLLEEFALNPEKRPDLVESIPADSADYYLYRLRLISQDLQDPSKEITSKRIDEAMAVLTSASVAPSFMHKKDLLEQFRNQFALLAYKVQPDLLLKQLSFKKSSVTQLDFAAQAEVKAATATTGKEGLGDIRDSLSSTLDQNEVRTDVLVDKILEEFGTEKSLSNLQVSQSAWPFLMARPETEAALLKLNPDVLLRLFKAMQVPISPKSMGILGQTDTSRADKLIVKMILHLVETKKLSFTENLNHFQELTIEQLDAMLEQVPRLIHDEGFVSLLEKRIVPRPSVDYEVKEAAEVHGEWLDRMVAFVDKLSPKFNRHKLSVYLMSLEYDLNSGVMDKAKFMKYIAIPRTHNYYNGEKLGLKEKNVVNITSTETLLHWSQRVKSVTQRGDDNIIREYLAHFITAARSFAEFEEYFSVKDFLEPILGQAMLTSGDKDVATWSKLLPPSNNLTKLTEQTIIKFSRGNPATFLPEDPVVFKLKVKNAQRVIVRVFEVKTLEYLQQHAGTVGTALNLEGLSPNWEQTLSFDHPPIEIHEVKVELPELANRRGAFVMDVICNGENSSAYFTKGYLDYIERQSVAGHVLTVIDENQKKITEDVGIWFNGIFYKTNEAGDIIIPYKRRSSDISAREIFITHNDFTTRRSFLPSSENYEMSMSCHVDHESLVAGSVAKVLIKPVVTVAGGNVVCPVELLEQVTLQVVSEDTSDTESTKTVLDFKVFDNEMSVYNFQVPENLQVLTITMTARIKVMATGEFENLEASKAIFGESSDSDQIVTVQFKDRKQQVQLHGELLTMLRRTAAGYEIHVMGKNGEKRPNVPMDITFSHPVWYKGLSKYLLSDERGIVHLGPLEDITSVTCSINHNSWTLVGSDKGSLPGVIHGIAGTPIQVPSSRQDVCYIRSISLFKCVVERRGTYWCMTEDCTDKIRVMNGLLTISDLAPGYYTLNMDGAKIEITVASAKASKPRIKDLDDYHVGVNPMLEVPDSARHPLHMLPAIADDEAEVVDIHVRNWTAATRVCIVATRFIPNTPMFDDLSVKDTLEPWRMPKTEKTLTTYSAGRILGEEYQYILNRKTQTNHWAGNLLEKPSVLLTPWSIADTTMSKQAMAATDERNVNTTTTAGYMNAVPGSSGRGLGRGGALRHRKILPPGLPPMLTFSAQPSVILTNLIPNQTTGQLRVPYSDLKECSFLQIYVTDAHQALVQTLPVLSQAETALQKRDLRFKSALNYTRHYIGERSGTQLNPAIAGASLPDGTRDAHAITLASNGSSSSAIRIINSVSQVYDLMATLVEGGVHKQNLKKFEFVTEWHRFSEAEKNEKFSKWNCHELNLFIYRKDRVYFDKVVKPFIKSKLLKSFVDDYLIGASLERYTVLTEFNHLTCMEKCLLAQRVPRLKPSVVQWIRSRTRNSKVASDVKLFRTVMRSGDAEEIPSSPGYSPTSSAHSASSLVDHESDSFESVTGSSLPPPPPPPMGGGGYSAASLFGSSATGSLFGSPAPGSLFGSVAPVSGFGAAVPVSGLGSSAQQNSLFGGPSAASPASPQRTSGSFDFGAPRSPATMTQSFGSARSSAPPPPPAPISARNQTQQMQQQQFKPVDLTKEMAETYYWGRQDEAIETNDANTFWMDYVAWDEANDGSFLSQNFVVNSATFTNAMATLALLDVTFKPKDASIKRSADRNLVVASSSPAIVFHSSTKESYQTPMTGSVIATQQYYKKLEKTIYSNKLGTNVRNYVRPGAEFRPLESYGAHVVLMNATPNPMKLHLEVQLPHGAMPIGLLEPNQDIELNGHGTFQYEYLFYFPVEGDFEHYPAHISDDEDIIAFAAPSVLKVRAQESSTISDVVDTTTWNYVVTRGSDDEVLTKLSADPLDGLPVEILVPRLYRNSGFLKNVTKVLRERHEYNERIWSVSLALNELDEELEILLQEYIATQPVSGKVGPWFTSRLLRTRPESRYKRAQVPAFHYLEYFPLINARTHKATRDSTILNDRFKTQFDRFLVLLCSKPIHEVNDLLVLIVYLLAQDRVFEAKEQFLKLSAMVQSQGLDQDPEIKAFQHIQYDYLRCYLSLCVEVQTPSSNVDGLGLIENLVLDLEDVLTILNGYRQYPVKRWNKLFRDMRHYVDEILKDSLEAVGDTATSTKDPTDQEVVAIEDMPRPADSTSVTVDFKISTNSQIEIRHQGVREVRVEYYVIDAETMFSSNPLTFSDQEEKLTSVSSGNKTAGGNDSGAAGNSYRLIKPNGVDKHLVEANGLLSVPILDQYLNTNVMISVSTTPAAATKTWRAYYSQTIDVQCNERAGTIKVMAKGKKDKDTANNSPALSFRPIRGGYVKVYAEMKSGYRATSFWKDGYTDLVGQFEYAKVSTGAANGGGLSDVRRFLVFVDGGKEGCVVKTVPVPAV